MEKIQLISFLMEVSATRLRHLIPDRTNNSTAHTENSGSNAAEYSFLQTFEGAANSARHGIKLLCEKTGSNRLRTSKRLRAICLRVRSHHLSISESKDVRMAVC